MSLLCPYPNLIDLNKRKFIGSNSFMLKENLYTTKNLPDGVIMVGCGKCAVCKAKHAIQWGNRCSCEAMYHIENYFVTLTYDIAPLQLIKKDLQDFIKRLRKAGYRFKYFASGEYGTKKTRPHYHVNFFGMHIDDLTFFKKRRKYNYYISEKIQSIWQAGESVGRLRGFVMISEFTANTASYTASYTSKKLSKNESLFKEKGIQQEFLLCSQGLGFRFWDDNIDRWFKREVITINIKDRLVVVNPPRSYLERYKSSEICYKSSRDIIFMKYSEIPDCLKSFATVSSMVSFVGHFGGLEQINSIDPVCRLDLSYDIPFKRRFFDTLPACLFILGNSYLNAISYKEKLLLELQQTSLTEYEYRLQSLQNLVDKERAKVYDNNIT